MNPYWTSEKLADGEVHRHLIKEIIYQDIGEHHKLEVLETADYGLGLFLDGRIQHLQHDEYIYSEATVHPAVTLLNRSNIHVLVVGGGPGGAIRELLKHNTVATVTQVEIDEGIIDLTKKYFQHVACGYHNDPRVNIVIADVRDYAQSCGETFDLIIYDVSEPLENSPASDLFSEKAILDMRLLLNDQGVFVTWGGSVGPKSSGLASAINRSISHIFPFCDAYICHPQSYGTSWLTVIGSMQDLAPLSRSPANINEYLEKHVVGDLNLYDGQTHHHMFNLPKDVRAALRTPSLRENPLQLYVNTSLCTEGTT